MINLVGYLLKEMKDGRLSKADVLALLAEQGTSTRGADDVHPLAQRNTSSFDEQRFSSTLRADSFFLSDHVVQGQKVLPAVCYLEMARAAVRASVEREGEPHAGLGFRDVTWLKPLIVADTRDVHIGLYAQESGDVEFEVYTDVVHAHGRAQWIQPSIAEEPCAVDVAGLRARCDRSFESATAYSAFGAMGLEYGAAHRGLTSLHAGADADGRRFVVAHVQLPPSASRGSDRYVLHPSVLDCALQASIGLVLGDGPIEPALPFALEAVEILDRTPSSAWVVVRPREAGSLEGLDIDVCDDAGRVCVRLWGLATRAVPSASRSDAAGRTMMLSPRWEAQPAVSTAPWPPADSSVLLVGDLPGAERWLRSRHPRLQTLAIGASIDEIARRLAAAGPIDHVVWAAPREGPANAESRPASREGPANAESRPASSEGPANAESRPASSEGPANAESRPALTDSTPSVADEAILQGQERGVIALFRLIKALLSRGYGERPLGLTAITWQAQAVVGDDAVDSTHASVHGLVGSLAKEYDGWKIRLVDLQWASVDVLTAALTEAMERLPPDPRGDAWAYRGGAWYRQKLAPCQLGEAQEPPYRRGGVYVVIGGAGGIGHVFSKHLVERYRAQVVWIGRREPNADIQAKIDELSALGPEPAYVRADAADRAELERAYASIKARYGQIHGVVHSAVTLLDGRLAEMDEARFKAALSAKADVCVRIAQVFAEEPLDWVLFFSSAQSFSKVAWQSNYAAGCTFEDAFAHQLGRQWPCAVKVMNWSYWGSVGVAASDADRARLAQFGVGSIEPEEGLPALDRLMGGPSSQVVFIKAIGSRALVAIGAVPEEPKEAGAPPVPQSSDAGPGARGAERLRALTIAALKRLLSRTLGAPLHELVESEPLLKYGLESILVVSLSNELKEFFPQLSSTVFFQRQTIGALATYLLEMDPEAVSRWVGLEERPSPAPRIDDVPTARRDGEATRGKGVSLLPRAKRGLRRRALTASPTTEPTREPIAIIGLSGRYPQARTVEQLWDNLRAGKSCITEVPNDRWDHGLYFDPEKGKAGKSYSKWGGFLDAIDRFDPLFFRISPAEAERIDPQERLFLQEAYACIADAGYTPATLCGSRRVGVYVGAMNSTYFRHATYWSIANRVSYVCDFQGPSMAVDTACSSSLTAIHLAIEALHSGSCEVAIAGGVHLIVDPVQLTNLSEMNMLSSDDRCKAFGARADGFVDGEGVGAIVLKPLHRAVADGDHVYGVIRGSLLNAGGKTHGYTVPNPTAQANLIEAVLRRANVEPRTISYVEAHGTGTELGDPIEIAGLTQAFASWTGDRQYCAIGSLKSNVGHLESAAGIAAVTKVLLQMQHQMLVPSLHSQELNPHIDFARTPFKVQQRPEEWRRPIVEIDGRQQEYPRIAGISSFGAGGSNAHLIVEEYCAAEPVGTSATEITPERPALIVLSAMSEERLRAYATELRAHLARHAYSDRDLGNIAYTLQVGREAMEHRIAFTATRLQDLEDKLQGYIDGRAERSEIHELYAGRVKRGNEMITLFTGDEELQEAVRKWVDRGKYSKLLELWVNGLSFDWSLLSGGRGRRIPLPTYPFAGERYWSDRRPGAAPLGAPALEPRSSSTSTAAEPSGAVPIPSVPAPVEEDDWAVGELMLAPQWEPATPLGTTPWPEPGDAVLWIGGTPEERLRIEALYPHVRALDVAPADTIPRIVERLSAGGPFTHVFWMAPREESSEPHAAVLSGLRLLKALVRAGYGEKALGLTVVTRQAYGIDDDERIDPDHAAAHGLVGSVAKEYPHWRIRIVDASDDGPWPAGEVSRLPADARGNAWAYRHGQWLRQRWHRYELAEHDVPTRFRHRGVYVVLGGAGRLGEALTEYLIQKYEARVVWIGRRALDEDIQAKIDRLGRLGPAPTYLSADAADLEELAQAHREIKAQHGDIHGLIHATMVMSGSDLAHMDETRFALGLRAKADVSVRMAQVFGEEPLDFVLFYSSIVSFERSPRQSNYAAGSVFNDAFAHRLSSQWARPVKIMNWGYCGPIPESLQNWLNEAGFSLIEPERAMVALEELLASPFAQLAFVSTTRARALKGIEFGRERLRRIPMTLPSLAQVLSTREIVAPLTKTRNLSAPGN
ncbi:SDR family NAD(P)-dependent oxidoreductase [Sorangium sp. So ce1151]|uniref:SDR family NAD(P)-dependent oxidoreductase n=1 Tax=Sorangium sp. So ce1151 TaxID=3133332 RepID=UPI003F623D46